MKLIYANIFHAVNDYDVIVHGCNCQCAMKSGIAAEMVSRYGCDKFPMECRKSANKLGCIDYRKIGNLYVVNAYTQVYPRHDTCAVDYDALKLCMKKIRWTFPNKKIILPAIGCGLAGGNPYVIFPIISQELTATLCLQSTEDFKDAVDKFIKGGMLCL